VRGTDGKADVGANGATPGVVPGGRGAFIMPERTLLSLLLCAADPGRGGAGGSDDGNGGGGPPGGGNGFAILGWRQILARVERTCSNYRHASQLRGDNG